VFINEAFESFVRAKIGDHKYEAIGGGRRKRMMRDFDEVKRSFAGEDETRFVELVGVDDSAAGGIVDGVIPLSG